MPYIAPNSTVEFFGNLGLNDNYDDSLYFASENAKNAYFTATQKLATCVAMTYTREQKGFIRVELRIGDIIGASYMRYKNTNFENKWFYAFVKNVEYINNNCTQVNFEIDPLMTWMGTFALNECFIERQHTIHDYIGSNVADEKLDTGDYVCQFSTRTYLLEDYTIVMFTTTNRNVTPPSIRPNLIAGIYSGLYMYYPVDQNGNPYSVLEAFAGINGYLEYYQGINEIDEVVSIMMLPKHFVQNPTDNTMSPITDEIVIEKPYHNFKYSTINGTLDTYTPRNKKLFTYPYNYLLVYSTEGQHSEFKYEYFNTVPDEESTGSATFDLSGSANIRTEVDLIPKNYRGMPKDYSQRLVMNNFPMCSWNVDSYKAYLAQLEASFGLKSSINLAKIGIGALTGNPIPLITGNTALINDVTNLVVSQHKYPSIPNENRGVQTSDLMVSLGAKDFYFCQMCINKSYAIMIDDYFDQFGYAIREHGVPNMNARPYWTYVKTLGCSVEGNIPADDAKAIEDIFNNGIRFWKNHTQIGNYSLNNAPND